MFISVLVFTTFAGMCIFRWFFFSYRMKEGSFSYHPLQQMFSVLTAVIAHSISQLKLRSFSYAMYTDLATDELPTCGCVVLWFRATSRRTNRSAYVAVVYVARCASGLATVHAALASFASEPCGAKALQETVAPPEEDHGREDEGRPTAAPVVAARFHVTLERWKQIL